MITVLLPAYNNSEYIESAIRSILNQTFTDFELLIIDDFSSDDTVERIKNINDPRIRLILNEKNLGLGRTLNLGLEMAKYDLVARMDSDDISLPDRLSVQHDFMTANPEIGVLSCSYAMMSGGKIIYTVRAAETHAVIRQRLVLHSEIMHPCVMYRKSEILKYGGYKNIPVEDYELWLRIKDSVVFHNIQEILLLKRYHKKSLSAYSGQNNKSVHEYTSKYYGNLGREFGIKKSQENLYRGWREYFYGDKEPARKYFAKSILNLILSPRALAACFITFLNDNNFTKFKESRVRFRLAYYLLYFSKENRKARKYCGIG
jgi:glycosyltransferase involved in cell wall biosynthesis